MLSASTACPYIPLNCLQGPFAEVLRAQHQHDVQAFYEAVEDFVWEAAEDNDIDSMNAQQLQSCLLQ